MSDNSTSQNEQSAKMQSANRPTQQSAKTQKKTYQKRSSATK